ncbi:MAG TPA: ATP synthase F1 subunit gamma [Alphaproteobacteria bacterium]|nr:ATP synthase F1 subunit gamma [Alphaproteobacteria bacterium]
MPSLRDIRRKISSVKKTQQITRAMQMVSAAKLQRAQDRLLTSRPYSNKLAEVISDLALRANPERHPLLQRRDGPNTLIVVVTADRGLCGAFNSNALRTATTLIGQHPEWHSTLIVVGRKGRDFFRRRPQYAVKSQYVDIFGRQVSFGVAEEIAKELIAAYTAPTDAVDQVLLVGNTFVSALRQQPTTQPLLPIPLPPTQPGEVVFDYLYEPSVDGLLGELLPRYVEVLIFRALLETAAAEHAARMTAMRAATDNAGELIRQLTLFYNKTRQAAITKEILEVVSGAEALKSA